MLKDIKEPGLPFGGYITMETDLPLFVTLAGHTGVFAVLMGTYALRSYPEIEPADPDASESRV